jgi:hypothetical protein
MERDEGATTPALMRGSKRDTVTFRTDFRAERAIGLLAAR